ncbi:hypothetical protein, partial [Bacillus badius]|uniref:hypothetical protein n=1 Tax=Bacillus badius TaxID=1455 RepID=UPI000596E1A0
MDDIETAKNLTVKARTAYSVWDVCRLFIEMIAPDVDIDIESKRKSDELLFPGYVIRPMESLTTGRPYGLDSSAKAVSYTHLDVYKRQILSEAFCLAQFWTVAAV